MCASVYENVVTCDNIYKRSHLKSSHFDYALISDTDNNFIDIALERLKSI